MDYFRLYKVGKIAYQTINKGTKIQTVLKTVAKPAAEFVVTSVIGVFIEEAATKLIDTYILKETK